MIEVGCERILTSGQMRTAPEGVSLITQLQQQANNKIIIMPGSGVRSNNIRQLADATGCTEFHTSLRELVYSEMDFITPAFKDDPENNHYSVNAEKVRALRRSLENG